MKNILTKTGLALGLVASMAAAGLAQQQTPESGAAGGERHERHGRRGDHPQMGGERHGGGFGMLRQLNLSDAQREQIRSIRENYEKRTEAQREELRQLSRTKKQGGELTPEQQARARQLRTELRATSESIHSEMLNVLTPEQRTQLEQSMKERREHREEFRGRRGERPNEQQ